MPRRKWWSFDQNRDKGVAEEANGQIPACVNETVDGNVILSSYERMKGIMRILCQETYLYKLRYSKIGTHLKQNPQIKSSKMYLAKKIFPYTLGTQRRTVLSREADASK